MLKKTDTSLERKCPICGKEVVFEYRPFCSKMCADVDLNRWLKGVYSTPSIERTNESEEKMEE